VVSAAALAGAPIALHNEVAQAQIPAYPPAAPALVAPAPPPSTQPRSRRQHHHPAMSGSPVIGRGTACNIFGSRGDMSRGRRCPRPIRPAIGSSRRTAGSGSKGAGITRVSAAAHHRRGIRPRGRGAIRPNQGWLGDFHLQAVDRARHPKGRAPRVRRSKRARLAVISGRRCCRYARSQPGSSSSRRAE
jgi:hypothetical protein